MLEDFRLSRCYDLEAASVTSLYPANVRGLCGGSGGALLGRGVGREYSIH